MESKDSSLTPSIVISPADSRRTKSFPSAPKTSVAVKQTSRSFHNDTGSESYEFKKEERRYYSSKLQVSVSSTKTVQSIKSSTGTRETVKGRTIEDGALCNGTHDALSSSPEPTPAEDARSTTVVETSNGNDEVPEHTETLESSEARKDTEVPNNTESAESYRWAEPAEPQSSSSSNSPSTSSRTSVHVGLVNQAMTCYLNSLIQALFMTPEFRNALYKWEFTGSSEEEELSIPFHLQKLFLNLQTSQRSAVETTKLTKSFGWDSSEAWHQHDIEELCRVMFEALERKFSNTEQADFIQKLYEGKMIDYVKCLECCKEKSREDTFMDIPLPVKPFGNPVAYETIEEALDGFVQAETLNDNNQYFCETCNKKCDAQKGLKFSHFPYILTLHLKRFDFDYHTMHRIKLNDKVSFPEVLNLNDYIGGGDKPPNNDTNNDSAINDVKSSCSTNGCSANGCQDSVGNTSEMCSCPDSDEGIDEGTRSDAKTCPKQANKINCDTGSPGPYKYELFSIMIHSGSASGGHYFAYIKDFDTNEWFCFNDDVVSLIPHEDIVENFCANNKNRGFGFTSTPYMLMYRQIDEEKNVTFMKADSFPSHIKKLVELVQKEDQNSYNRKEEQSRRRATGFDNKGRRRCVDRAEEDNSRRIKVHFQQDGSEKLARWLCYSSDETLGDFLNVAAEVFAITDVPLRKLRLAVCTPGVEHVEEIKGEATDLIKNFVPENGVCLTLYIQEDVPAEGEVTVQLVSLDSSELFEIPIQLEYTKGMTVGELKEKLSSYFPSGNSPPLNRIFVTSSRPFNRNVFTDDTTVQLAKTQSSKLFAAFTGKEENMNPTACLRCLSEILSKNVVDVKCKFIGISKKHLTRFGTNTLAIQRTDWERRLAVPTHLQNGESAKEDTIVADSEKALAGDGASSNLDLKSIARSAVEDQNFGRSSSNDTDGSHTPLETPLNRNAKKNFSDTLFTIQHINEDDCSLSLTVDSEMEMCRFKEILAQFIGFPTECIKLYYEASDKKECALSRTPIGDVSKKYLKNLCIKVVKPKIDNGTVYWKIHTLNVKEWVAEYIFDCGLSKCTTVSEAKRIILEEMQERGFDEIPIDRCRLRHVMGSRPRGVLFDDQTLRFYSSYDKPILVQEREGPETIFNSCEELVLVRNFDRRDDDLGKELCLECVVSFYEDIKEGLVRIFYEELSSETGIPVDDLDVRILYLSSAICRQWKRKDMSSGYQDSVKHLIDSGHAFFYRDNRVPIKDKATMELWNEYVPVKEYLEGNTNIDPEPLPKNSSENVDSTDCGASNKQSSKAAAELQLDDDARPSYKSTSSNGDISQNGDTVNNVTKQTDSSEPAREAPKSYRSKERGLKIYVGPTPQKTNEQQSNGKDVASTEESKE